MTFSDTGMMELGITQSTNIHNTKSLIRTLKYVLDILQTEEASMMEEYKHKHTHIAVSVKYLIIVAFRIIVFTLKLSRCQQAIRFGLFQKNFDLRYNRKSFSRSSEEANFHLKHWNRNI